MIDSERIHEQFVELLQAHSGRIYSYIRTLVLNDLNDAEDVFQNTCAAAWAKFSEFEQGSSFGAWACQIAYFEVLRERRNRRRIRFLTDEAIADIAEAAMPIAESVHERRQALASCVAKLSSEDLSLVKARYFEAVRPKQIAQRAGRSIDSVYRDLRRINRQLLRCVRESL